VAVVRDELSFVESLKDSVSEFEVFFPHFVKTEKRRFWKKSRQVVVPIFPGYVFLKVSYEQMSKVRKAQGYKKMLRKVGSLDFATIDDEQVEELRSMSFEPVVENKVFRSGDKVEVVSSVLKGCFAVVVDCLQKSPYIKVLIEETEKEILLPKSSIRAAV
jgi:transcription antitermination factor NusG